MSADDAFDRAWVHVPEGVAERLKEFSQACHLLGVAWIELGASLGTVPSQDSQASLTPSSSMRSHLMVATMSRGLQDSLRACMSMLLPNNCSRSKRSSTRSAPNLGVVRSAEEIGHVVGIGSAAAHVADGTGATPPARGSRELSCGAGYRRTGYLRCKARLPWTTVGFSSIR